LAPLEKTRSWLLASTTTRTASSSRADSNASISSVRSSFDSALRVSGWLSVIVATPASSTS
jgi:hypothetical protein